MSPASMGAEIFTCWRTMAPTLAAVIFVAAVLALVRALLPPKVGQSPAAPPARMLAAASCVPGASDCWDNAAHPHVVATAQVRSALWTIRMPYPLIEALYSIPYTGARGRLSILTGRQHAPWSAGILFTQARIEEGLVRQ